MVAIEPERAVMAGEPALEAPGQAGEVAVRVAATLGAQQFGQGRGPQRGGGHALPIDRVEGTGGIAQDDESLGPAGQVFVPPPAVFGAPIPGDRGERLGLGQGFVDKWATQAAGELQKRRVGGRGVIPSGPISVTSQRPPSTT